MEKKVLFITLTNIGDVILTLPVFDEVRGRYPGSLITVLGSAQVRDIFEGNPLVKEFIIYNKKDSLKKKVTLALKLLKEDFDVIVDLKDTFLGAVLNIRRGNLLFKRSGRLFTHMKDIHLSRIGGSQGRIDAEKALYVKPEENKRILKLLEEAGFKQAKDVIICVAAGSRSETKRWPKERFAEVCRELLFKRPGVKILLLGDKEDIPINEYIGDALKGNCLDLTGKTNLRELACLLKASSLLVSNDSAIMHMASYLDLPVVGIFGITSNEKYGPWSKVNAAVRKEVYCRPCQKAQCRFGTLRCLFLIKTKDVLRQAERILDNKPDTKKEGGIYKRILVIRTDRIGDVVLSTPVIGALRESYPNAFIAAMVAPCCKEILDGNPDLDEVIVYDKEARHRNFFGSLGFLKKVWSQRFDLAIILHPTNRAHLISFLAGIPVRVGYRRKMGFLLTHGLAHRKELGEQHEVDYNLDLLKIIGISVRSRRTFVPLKKESERWANDFLQANGITHQDKLLAINPGASCPSKIWPAENFSRAADLLSKEYGFKVLIVCGPKECHLADAVIRGMSVPAFSLAGKTSITQLTSILKRCVLFISNDSGPVHIACALGVPVISIFGRKQPGLSPVRWGPLGANSRFLHKDIGCIECFAHNCRKSFACLKQVTAEDVFSCAKEILGG